ncbi:MAG TPA: DUF2520 domain-containing protein [Candidatus Angelobacter sp.]|nr:DUF2520 domain-containing protein [Candidatus Angelobacter sp.]
MLPDVVTPTRIPTHITIVGAGNLAQVLAPALQEVGYSIDAVVVRDRAESRRRASALARKLRTRALPLNEASPVSDSDIVWLCHTDDAITATARLLAKRPGSRWKGKVVLHSSGALTSDALAPLRSLGASVASLHPMMTFVPGAAYRLAKVPFAVEGDRRAIGVARQIAKALQAEIFTIGKESKVFYHALGSFSSPLLVAVLITAEQVARAAGLSVPQMKKTVRPLVQQTIQNYFEKGAAAAFSGPIRRGDVETVRRHLSHLSKIPEAREVYRALVHSALLHLPAKNQNAVRGLLKKAL